MLGSSNILIYSGVPATRRHLLAKARQVASQRKVQVQIASVGADEPSDQGNLGADCVYAVTDARLAMFNVDLYADALECVIAQAKPAVVLLGTSKRDYELGPGLAERLGVGCVSACVDFDISPKSGDIVASGLIYAGLGIAHYRVKGVPAILLIAPRPFVDQATDKFSQVVSITPQLRSPKINVLPVNNATSTIESSEQASVVIDVGQGIREQKDLALVQPLVDALHADVGCTRPISSERGWFPTWLGMSGLKVTPRLCITLGVSGAIQHMVGIRGSEVIVAIDSSPDSAMLVQADYGVVADLYEFAPALAQEIAERQLSVP